MNIDKLGRSLDLTSFQKDWLAKIKIFYRPYLEKYKISAPELKDEQLRIISINIDPLASAPGGYKQFGAGGVDKFISDNIFITAPFLKPELFPYALAHGYAHFISCKEYKIIGEKKKLTKYGTQRLMPKKIYGLIKKDYFGYELINEGITDFFCRQVLKENNYIFKDNDLTQEYNQQREIIKIISNKTGIDCFLKSYFTGVDDDLIKKIDDLYADKGGYKKYIEFLDKIAGLKDIGDDALKTLKGMFRGIDLYYSTKINNLENDNNYKQLLNWV